MNDKFLCRLALVCLCSVLLLGGCSDAPAPSESLDEASQDSALVHAAKHLDPKYVCPMHPQIVRDDPANCPICGMDLVAKQIDPNQDQQPSVQISSAVIQNMGVRTALARRETLWKYIQTIGRLTYDETRLAHVHPRTEGWIETLKLRAEGDPVKKGEQLGSLYAPEILAAQVDFLIAIDQQQSRRPDPARIEKARNRLRLLGVDEATISRIQRRGETQNTVPLLAPEDGVVTQLGAREGMFVMPEMEVFTVADLSKMWVLVDVYEHQLAWLRKGLSAEIRVPAYPGQRWQGTVDYIYPELDPQSRTLQVRLIFDNPDGRLKANMFADVSIYGGPQHGVLTIPREALIETGTRTSVVLAQDKGRFQPVDVVTGMRRGDQVEIISGLKEGDRVVTSGQFLIDSESSLRASFSRLQD